MVDRILEERGAALEDDSHAPTHRTVAIENSEAENAAGVAVVVFMVSPRGVV